MLDDRNYKEDTFPVLIHVEIGYNMKTNKRATHTNTHTHMS